MVDRDLLSAVTAAGGIALVVEGTRRRREWDQLGASAVLPASFDERQLLAVIEPQTSQVSQAPPAPKAPQASEASHARSIEPRAAPRVPAQATHSQAPLVAVTGPGGTGASVVAIALSQGLAASRRRVLLVDACLHAEQSMLHNAHGAQPGLMEMVELHSAGAPSVRQVRQLAIGIVERGYHLLVGLRRARHWSSTRPASLQVTLQSLRAAFDMVVADVDAEVDGEAQTGSVEVEERNGLARTTLAVADLVLVVGQPNMKGVYALVRTLIDLLEFGVAPQRLLPVINQAGRCAS
jgi:MinD-like ATPase involved in chromosome partitioning or flagellar assembly